MAVYTGKNTGVSCPFLLQGVCLTQGSNPYLPHWRVDSLLLSHMGSPDSTYKCFQMIFVFWLTSLSMIRSRSIHVATNGIAAAAAKLLQSCPTLCDPVDGSPPGSSVPGILQARILEWVAISFSNAGKWKVKVKSLSHVRLLATPWTAAYQALPSIDTSKRWVCDCGCSTH